MDAVMYIFFYWCSICMLLLLIAAVHLSESMFFLWSVIETVHMLLHDDGRNGGGSSSGFGSLLPCFEDFRLPRCVALKQLSRTVIVVVDEN